MQEPTLDLAWDDARRRLRSHPGARWHPSRDEDETAGMAVARMRKPLFDPVLEPGFAIDPGDRLFAVGSCFARGLEKEFDRRGLEVPSYTHDFDDMVVAKVGKPEGITNKYTPFAILNEFRWALDAESGEFPAEALVEREDGDYSDPHSTPVFAPADREETLRRRRLIIDVNRRIVDCRIVVITLGLVEAWYDTLTGLYTNSMPAPSLAEAERFRFHVLSYQQVWEALEGIHALLSRRAHPDVRVIVTVSPVPLSATFGGRDVVIANTNSKSTLRAAADAWAAAHENVHYFPSYEIVMNSERGLAWGPDGRHVQGELVRHVMDVFARTHLDEHPAVEPAAA